jgi:hypothetical protein
MNKKTAVALIVLVGALATPALAERGTPREQDACRRDVVRLCRAYPKEDGPILDCLKTFRARLSHGCRTVLENHGQ